MRRLLGTVVILTVGMFLIVGGCQKKTQDQPEAAKAEEGAAKATEATAPAAKTAEANAAASADAAKAATDAAKAMGAGEAPEVMKKMAGHIKGITAAIKDNMSDCKKAAAAANQYVKDNQADFDAFKKYSDSVPDADKAKMAMQFQALVTPLIQEYVAVQMQFSQKCAAEAKELAELMKKMRSK